jgi:hypothetical protein
MKLESGKAPLQPTTKQLEFPLHGMAFLGRKLINYKPLLQLPPPHHSGNSKWQMIIIMNVMRFCYYCRSNKIKVIKENTQKVSHFAGKLKLKLESITRHDSSGGGTT